MSKRLRFFVIALALCMCGIVCLCSFAPPVIGWTTYNIAQVTETDVDNLIAITDFQYKYGSFNGYVPAVCSISSNSIRVYCVPSNSTWTVTQSGNNFDVQVTGANTTIMRSYFSPTGFGMQYTSSTASGSNLLFYCPQAGEYVKGQNYVYSTNLDSDVIAECAAEWYEAFKVVDGYESAIEEAESEGYAEGESAGYTNGYTAGYNQGEYDGLGAGFDLGYADGITDGYESGFDRGYAEGYIDGYDTGVAEGGGGTPVEPPSYELDIPAIFDGMAGGVTGILSAFDIEVFGISVVGLLIAIIVIAIVAFVVRKLMK